MDSVTLKSPNGIVGGEIGNEVNLDHHQALPKTIKGEPWTFHGPQKDPLVITTKQPHTMGGDKRN